MTTAPEAGPRLQLGDADVTSIDGGRFRLDGGSMFGLVPRPMWQACVTPDEAHRVPLACNCLLVRSGREVVLVDTGLGSRFTERERGIYGIDGAADLSAAVCRTGVAPEAVTQVVFTHLHFDHLSGALRGGPEALEPRFPNAVHVVQQDEWEDALAGHSTMRTTYRAAELRALAQRVEVRRVTGDVILAQGLTTWVTGGHTRGHQGVRLQAGDTTFAYPADILPTQWHAQPHWGTAYDMSPYDTLQCKLGMLPRACAERWIVAYNHDAQTPWSRLALDGRRYVTTPLA